MSNNVCFVFVKLAVLSVFVVTVAGGCGSGGSGAPGAGATVTAAGGAGATGGSTNSSGGMAGATGTSSAAMQWVSVASSADGTKLVAAAAGPGGMEGAGIYTSVDSGVTWIRGGNNYTYWTSVASSADGTKLVAAAGGDLVNEHQTPGRAGPRPAGKRRDGPLWRHLLTARNL